ncbi:hypothetical protein PLESTB_000041800 [Pleodorina starrii]|uniref:VOC domain-containing protein n=1 Tax=Pleodorina starrii TaxID=330485 RepID=A0A9W6EW40_9CHLO|nr:hypothetical protein PLESTB_000041800 [Pleodorina starrii]
MHNITEMESRRPLQLLALNHVSRVCSDLAASYRFYTEVLGFTPVKRPSSFEFDGAWLHNYGIGLHLIKGCPPPRPKTIIPKSCHISFQAANLAEVEDSLVRQGILYVKNLFVEDGVKVGQLFFHDPDNNMIEICNCEVLPVVPVDAANISAAARGLPTHATTATATGWPSSPHGEPAAPAALDTLSAAPSSDAGSDDSLQGTYEAMSSLLPEPVTAAATGPDPRVAGLAADDAAGRLEYGSFSSGMSSVTMSDPLSMSITASDMGDWSSRVAAAVAAGASSSSSCISSIGGGGVAGSFMMELSQQRA